MYFKLFLDHSYLVIARCVFSIFKVDFQWFKKVTTTAKYFCCLELHEKYLKLFLHNTKKLNNGLNQKFVRTHYLDIILQVTES